MSLPRLSFLYPPRILKTATTLAFRPCCKRHRHGAAVDPTHHTSSTSEDPQKIDPSIIQAYVGTERAASIEGKEASNDGGEENTETTKDSKSKDQEQLSEPLDTIEAQSPNLAPRQYVHHFDTYSLVQRLENGGAFNRGQSVAVMKGIRGLLSLNMDAARNNLVSKSNVENESYLFQAACSELRNEIQNNRKVQVDLARAERTRIQQDFDLLNQRFLGEIMSLKDELNGMFNDRKMVTRAEQRAMENKIQELNYKITILINSDLKSEIEKLRWVTTRRGLTAIALLAILIMTSIQTNKRADDGKKNKKTAQKDEENEHPQIAPEKKSLASLAESLANGGEEGSGASFESLG